ncbi:uncharacterized protein LOC108739495 [Agrilus planipennis]|uniref:Uncharacterized protein LOC108739495 n=1 Tax=Agrilus planipennis TaxID=224129 RepID=A0A1W4WYJ0_AGRPL|nr:uncharacterized protein LOC108739495 [Agrilus planipennis]
MFYQLKLLCSQKEGIFADVWIAATLGVKRLTKNQIHNTDIVKISKEIEEMIVTQSHHPKKRLSLRLAVILVNGATKIYLQQVITLQEEILSFLCYVRRPIKLTDESIKRPRNVKAKKRPRPKQQPETSNEQEQIEIPPGSYIRKLSDTHYTSAIAEEVERTRIGPGPIEWGDEFIRQIEELAELERIQEGAKET